MKSVRQLPRLVVFGIACLVSMAALLALAPQSVLQYGVGIRAVAGAVLTTVFGPYLLAVGCTTGFLPGLGSFLGLAVILPFYAAHVAFVAIISKRTSLWHRFGRFGECARKAVVVIWSLLSALGVWYEMPCVTKYDVAVDGHKIPVDGIRLALVTDLHSCRYGTEGRALVETIKEQKPDAVLLSGDIFDDRLPDDNAKAFLFGIARDIPCFFAFGNHEHWSERVPEMRDILVSAGVTVLVGDVRTIKVKGAEIDMCGIDDPTYMSDDAWLGQLASVASATTPSRLKILISHRPEYAGEYEKHGFDLVVSGHLHGGQWGIPFLGLGFCGPSSGGPDGHERFLFPRMAGGAYRFKNGTTMVVSRGLARESTPLPRLFNHPELVIIDLGPRMENVASVKMLPTTSTNIQ